MAKKKVTRTQVKSVEKSELQQAVDRLEAMKDAISVRREHLAVCLREVDQTLHAYEEAQRNLRDTQSLLSAQEDKYMRELNAVHDSANRVLPVRHNYLANDCCKGKEEGFPY